MIIRIEEKTLIKAYKVASKKLKCNIKKLDIKIIKKESNGFLGIFKSNAIIDAKKIEYHESLENKNKNKNKKKHNIEEKNIEEKNIEEKNIEEKNIEEKNIEEKKQIDKENQNYSSKKYKNIEIIDKKIESKNNQKLDVKNINKDNTYSNESNRFNELNINLAREIEFKLKKIIDEIFENIDIIEVDIFNNTAHIFIEGKGIPILIGNTGYGYDSARYFISIWLKKKYSLYLDLEIGIYKKNRLENLNKYLTYFIEEAKSRTRHRTKVINIIFISHAMKRLQEEIPNKFIKIKSNFNKDKFISVEDFYKN